MSYQNNFQHADDIINHLNTVMPELNDPLLKAKYTGFVAIAAVTVFEMAIKEIFIEFGSKKHKVLGAFTESYFDRINGRIKLDVIKQDYIKKFGAKYLDRFKRNMRVVSKAYLQAHRRDIANSYANLIVWRNDFAHEGCISNTATYGDVAQAYEDGKQVIYCLAKTMVR